MANTATGRDRLYIGRCRTAWTSDDQGLHTWNLGWVVYANDILDDDQKPFVVYEDDGRGNGDYVGDYDTLDDAKRAVNQAVATADARGW